MTEGIASSEDLEALRKEVDDEINKAADIAIATPQPAAETALTQRFFARRRSDRSADIRYRGRCRAFRQSPARWSI